ncbi:MAG TPA: hypothetical protein VGH50_05470 [Candidatus Binatia bacterium]
MRRKLSARFSSLFGALPADAAGLLGLVRAAVFVVCCIKIAVAPLAPLAALPPYLFEPISLLGALPRSLQEEILRPDVLTIFQIVAGVAAALAACGARPYRLWAVAACVLFTAHQALLRSFGHINHQEISLLFAAYALALFPAGDAFTPWPRNRTPRAREFYTAPIFLAAAGLLLPYCGIAAYRLARSGFAALTGASLPAYYVKNSLSVGYEPIGNFILQHPLIAKASQATAPVVLFFELTAPLALVYRRYRHFWLGFAVVFHLLSWLFMYILFWESLLLALVILPVLDRLSERREPSNAAGAA